MAGVVPKIRHKPKIGRQLDMATHRLNILQMKDEIWRPQAFDRVSVHSAGRPVVSILGICYGDYSTLNACAVADAAAELCGPGFYGLNTYRRIL